MIKKNKWKLLASSIVILLPALFGLLFWNKLPEQMISHWGFDGNAGSWDSRTAVYALPLGLLAVHWLCLLFTSKDPGNRVQNKKVFNLIFWCIPVISLFSSGMMYIASFGKEIRADIAGLLLVGLVLVVIGNYMPKCKRNYTIGVRMKWTLQSEENWNATHRFCGKVWFAGGMAMMACVFLPDFVLPWVLGMGLVVLVVLPIAYSWRYYKKQLREGAIFTPISGSGKSKKAKAVSLCIVAAILVFVAVIMFTGEIYVEYGEESFTIKANYWSDLTVAYDAVGSIEYRDSDSPGMRTSGLGTGRLLAGLFRNGEFGNYTRYSYTGSESCVVLDVEGKTLVVGGADAEATQAIYEEIKARTGA